MIQCLATEVAYSFAQSASVCGNLMHKDLGDLY